jgi:TM2 domain-containing membrane protein YozV
MKYFLPGLLFITSGLLVQAQQINFRSTENIRKFADYLFCDGDYLRAALEYENLSEKLFDDTLRFKTGLSYSIIREYSLAHEYFAELSSFSELYDISSLERMKLFFLQTDFKSFQHFYTDLFVNERSDLNTRTKKLYNISFLLSETEIPPKGDFLAPFDIDDEKISSLYNWKNDPPYKSPVLAGILSAIIPGSGKVYAGETGDGIVGFLTSAVFSFIAYDNFNAGHKTRGWIWTGIAGVFYAGNVYGSVAAAQIYNAKITFQFNDEINLYLNKNNYFIPEYDFCN